ncbi:MAG: hypothetical protein OHK0046_02980 [Anaerolineae bacterium]
MSDNQPREFTGEDIEKAIQTGLKALGVTPGDVLVEVLEEPSRGVFGIGARPARVSLRLLRPPEPPKPPAPAPAPPKPAAPTAQPKTTPPPAGKALDVDFDEDEDDDYEYDESVVENPTEDGAIGKEVLLEILHHMNIEADIIVRRAEPNRPGEGAPWLLDITGPDMSLLIGRRGETLSSLQYITRLIASRRLQRRANIIVDAGGYKSRRSKRLRELAVRMADQAVAQARPVSLEPMPPNERRIIHLELRGRKDVETQSTGEGNARKVTIIPKNKDNK